MYSCIMLKAYRYRLYPTEEQKVFFAKTFGCCRVVYNRTLDYMSMFWNGAGVGRPLCGIAEDGAVIRCLLDYDALFQVFA